MNITTTRMICNSITETNSGEWRIYFVASDIQDEGTWFEDFEYVTDLEEEVMEFDIGSEYDLSMNLSPLTNGGSVS